MKLRKNDVVRVIRGKDAGKTGKIEKVFSKEQRILVGGVNQYKRHLKKRSQNQQSEIVTITKPLPVANVDFVCPKCNAQTRIGYAISEDKKYRICKGCKAKI